MPTYRADGSSSPISTVAEPGRVPALDQLLDPRLQVREHRVGHRTTRHHHRGHASILRAEPEAAPQRFSAGVVASPPRRMATPMPPRSGRGHDRRGASRRSATWWTSRSGSWVEASVGSTTALCLRHQGIACEVHERAPELNEIGAGLGLWPAPLAVFDRLGLGDAVRDLSGPWEEAGLRRADGSFLVRYTADEMIARLGGQTIGVHRGELQALLLAALPDGRRPHGAGVHGRRAEVRSRRPAVRRRQRARAAGGDRGRRSPLGRAEPGVRREPAARLPGRRLAGHRTGPARVGWQCATGETWGGDVVFGVLPLSRGRMSWYAAARRFLDDGGRDELRDPVRPPARSRARAHRGHARRPDLARRDRRSVARPPVGARDAWRCWATPPTPWRPTSAKVPARRSSTPGRSPPSWPIAPERPGDGLHPLPARTPPASGRGDLGRSRPDERRRLPRRSDGEGPRSDPQPHAAERAAARPPGPGRRRQGGSLRQTGRPMKAMRRVVASAPGGGSTLGP